MSLKIPTLILEGRKACKFFSLLSLVICITSSGQPPRFQHLFGGLQEDVILTQDTISRGRIVTMGQSKSFGQGDYDIIAAVQDSFGNVVFSKSFGGIQTDVPNDVKQMPSGKLLIVGNTKSFGINPNTCNAFICLCDSSLNLIWQKVIGGSGFEMGRSVVYSSSTGYIYACGTTGSQGLGQEDVLLLKLDTLGNIIWQKTFGSISNEQGGIIRETFDKNLAFIYNGDSLSIGNFGFVKIDTSGNVLWKKNFGGSANDMAMTFICTADSGYAIAAGGSSFGSGSNDVYLLKLTRYGVLQWMHTYGDIYDDNVRDILEYKDDLDIPRNYFLCGFSPGFESDTSATWGNYRGFLICTDLSGSMQWIRMYGQGPSDYFLKLNLLRNHDLLIAGSGGSSPWGGADEWLVRTGILGFSGCNQITVNTTQTVPNPPLYSCGVSQTCSLNVSNSGFVTQNISVLFYPICTNYPSVSVSEYDDENSLAIFPNPNSGEFTISILKRDIGAQCTVINSLSQTVLSKKLNHENESILLDISVPDGVYFIEVLGENIRYFQTMILRRN